MKKLLILGFLTGFLLSCGGKTSNDPKPEPPVELIPGKVILLSPAQNELCTQGTTVSATQSTVSLKWMGAVNADSYIINIRNLESNVSISQTTTSTQLNLTLTKNTPYTWSITSKSAKSSSTAISDSWRFYNSGPGIVSYAPFPANLITPALGQSVNAVNGKTTLTWAGNDVDKDIVSYSVYLGLTTNPPILKSGLTNTTLSDVNVTAGMVYYWKVITIDAQGNTSDSGMEQFKVL